MISDKKFEDIIFEIYRELFKQANPSADFDELHACGITKQDGFFDEYFLCQSIQDEITEAIIKRHKLRPHERESIRTTILLGCSPRGYNPE